MPVTYKQGGQPQALSTPWEEVQSAGPASFSLQWPSEAEYMAAAQAVKEALWLKTLLCTFGIKVGAIKIYCDSQGAIKLRKHPIASIRSKHIDIIHHFARERVSRNPFCFEYISTEALLRSLCACPLQEGVPVKRTSKAYQ